MSKPESLADMQRWLKACEQQAENTSNPAAQEYWENAAQMYRERIKQHEQQSKPG